MKRVFISFKMEDKPQVDGVRLMAYNDGVELEFYDESVRSPFDSVNADYIKSKIRPKIARASVCLCLLGKNTSTSKWVNWELRTALDNDKPVVVMGLKDGPSSLRLPAAINGHRWWPWNLQTLQNMIDNPWIYHP